MRLKAVSGIMLTLLLLGILLVSVLLLVSSAEQTGNPRYFAAYSGQSTMVSGVITTNTTWTLADSPYIVLRNVIVEHDAFLTIEPGVVVKFTNETSLVVDGGLIAQGNSTHKITFTSNATAPAKKDWRRIWIRGGQVSNVTHCIIEYANRGLFYEGTQTLSVMDTLLRFNTVGLLMEKEIHVSNTTFVDNSLGIERHFETLWIDNSLFSSNGWLTPHGPKGGAIAGSRSGGVMMQNCTVSFNFGTGVGTPISIKNSNFTDNQGSAIGSDAQLISHCNIINNTNAFNRPVLVEHCNISGNINPGNLHRISDSYILYNSNGLDLMSNGVVERCIVSFNTRFGIKTGANSLIINSVITHNEGPGIMPNYGDYEPFEVHFSNIYNNTGYDLTLQNVFSDEKVSADVNATYNLWGTTNEALIEKHIYDYYDKATLGRVFYKPYLTAPTHHDIAVIDVTASPTTVTLGDSVSIEATVFNNGDFTETFNVTVFCDTNVIGTQTMTDLSPRAEMSLSFVWDTSGVAEGIYEIGAEASVVEGEEDTANNRFVDGSVTVLALPVASFNYTPLEPLVGDVVTFNASESYDPDGVITSWNWDFGDGNVTTVTGPVINHVYAFYGVFTVNLTVTDNDGLVDNEIKSITVQQNPTASFIYYPSIPEMGGNVLFDASASTPNGGTILSYSWNFGDGNVTDTPSPTILHVYFGYGNFTVTLSIQDDEGLTDVEKKIIHVYAPPVVDFTYTPASPVVYEFVTFNASDSFDFDGYLVIYVWDFGDGTNATEPAPIVQHSYSQPGTYTVALSVIDNDGLATTIMKDVNVGKIPAFVSISTSSPSSFVGFKVNITGTLQDMYGNYLNSETVVLYYTFSGITTWTPITSDTTDDLGNYNVMWIPPATGYFEIKAEWAGNTTHLGATNTTTLSSLAYEDQYVFCVESNSTITDLAFNTTDWTLSFAATGPDGTTGYVKVTVAKSLAANPSDIKVLLDGEQLEFSIASVDDSWLLSFTYEHSTHQVAVDLDVNIIPEFPTWALMLLVLVLLLAASAIYKRR